MSEVHESSFVGDDSGAPALRRLAVGYLEELERRWRAGERLSVETLLKREPTLNEDRDIVLDLIYREILLREQEGDHPRQDEYVQRFPHLADELKLQFEVDRGLDVLASSIDQGESSLVSSAEIDGRMLLPTVPGYEIFDVLGRGGMGIVYKARHLGLNRLVALKMVLAGVHAGQHELARFRIEAEAVARLQHPNIVQVYDIGSHDGRPYIAFEFVDNRLGNGLTREPLPVSQAAPWLETLARTVHYAHQQGIVHRDLKPANVLLGRNGVIKITDFGMAKIVAGRTQSETHSGTLLGTPSYMAPEQATGNIRQIGPSTDIYGLGAILYEFLTGRAPFVANSVQETLSQVCRLEPVPPRRIEPRVPRDLETICLRCLSKEPSKRYPTAEALADDLTAFLAGEPIRSRRAGLAERLAQWARRRPAEAMLAATGIMALVGLCVGLVWSHVLAVGAAAGLSLLLGAWWFSARWQRALVEATQQRVLADLTVERLHLLLEMTRRLMRTAELDDLLRLLAETTVWLANAELATIYLIDADHDELWSRVTLDAGVGEIRMPLGVGIAGTVATTGKAIDISDAYADPRFNPEVDRRTRHKTRNLLTIPMIGDNGSVLGVFQIINKQDGAFGTDDIQILSALAASAAIAIERALSAPGARDANAASA